jgi:hypothetical protein
VVFGERHLRHLLCAYPITTSAAERPFLEQGLAGASPIESFGRILPVPILDGLHHRYVRSVPRRHQQRIEHPECSGRRSTHRQGRHYRRCVVLKRASSRLGVTLRRPLGRAQNRNVARRGQLIWPAVFATELRGAVQHATAGRVSYRLTPWVPNNQNAEVSHSTIRMAKSTPPARGSAQPG